VAHGRCLHQRHLGNPLDIQVRQLYETQNHLSVERRIADRLAHRTGCGLIKLPIRYNLDYALTRNDQVVGFSEIKTTKYEIETHQSYGGFKMSFAKWCAAEQMCRLARLPFILLVGFPDEVRFLRTTNFEHDGIAWWGRQDRGDAQDMEPAVKLDLNRFAVL
jgi:hypothetical protein